MRSLALTILLGCVFLFKAQPSFSQNSFLDSALFMENKTEVMRLNWDNIPNQTWIGYNFWQNSFLDWRVVDHKVTAFPFFSKRRTAHITSHSISNPEGRLIASAKIKLFEKVKKDTSAIYGFLIGAGDSSLTQRTNNFVFNTLSPGPCHLFGIKSNGQIVLKDYHNDSIIYASTKYIEQVDNRLIKALYQEEVEIRISYNTKKGAIVLDLYFDGLSISESIVFGGNPTPPSGNIALFYHSKTPFTENATFDDVIIFGEAFKEVKNQIATVGPILSSFYTNTRDSLFLTAQLMPLNKTFNDKITLDLLDAAENESYEGVYDSSNYQVRFRIKLPLEYKNLAYELKYKGFQSQKALIKRGVINPSPINKKPKLMALNCNGFTFFHSGGIDYKNLFYPYRKIKEGYLHEKPDVLTFLGDQIYESRPEMAIYKHPFSRLDYLYKWSIWCYAFRDITLDQPTIIMTDDHDVFQGNIWGNGGIEAKVKPVNEIPDYYGKWNYDTWQQDNGGYFMGTDFVNMVTTSQTSHLPYPNKKKLKNGMINYYTSYKYGNLDIAILEDKKFKSPPSENNFKVYNGFSIEDSTSVADYHQDQFKLLGKEQLSFLEKWANKERVKHVSKVILTQSAYASLTTVQIDYTALKDRPAKRDSTPQKVSPDMDTNGWPKIGRDRALNSLGNNNVLFISGDQHMGAVIDVFDSAQIPRTFFSVPAIANTWPRMWWPNNEASNPNYPLGFYTDAFGNKMNVQAVANPNPEAPEPNSINYKSPGFGIIEFDKKGKAATLHAYPLYFNTSQKPIEFNGWPVKVNLKN